MLIGRNALFIICRRLLNDQKSPLENEYSETGLNYTTKQNK